MAKKDDITPGRFAEIPSTTVDSLGSSRRVREIQGLSYSDDLIAIYTAFRDQVYRPESVLYPSCAFDASPARVFDSVTFVDIEDGSKGCVRRLQEAGFTAFKQDIKDYTPNSLHDLLILLNPCIPPEWASRHLRPGGYIIANNYHQSATNMVDQPDKYTLWGTIDFVEKDRRKEDYKVSISRDLTDLFTPVSSFEEFRRLRPSAAKFQEGMINSFAESGMIDVDPNASFDDKWTAYRDAMRVRKPSRRVVDRYIFVKK